jgi:hypothetical protein
MSLVIDAVNPIITVQRVNSFVLILNSIHTIV